MDLYAELGFDTADPGMRSAIDMERQRRSLMRKLIDIRNARGLSTSDVAKELQVSPQAAARIEAGNRDARLSTITRYAIAVGAHVSIEIQPVEEVYETPKPAESETVLQALVRRLTDDSLPRARYESPSQGAEKTAPTESYRVAVNVR